MSIPKNISKDDLIKAIRKIDSEGIPNDGESRYYDLIYNGKKYPPKVVVAYANLYANGEILDRNKFPGGIGTACFKLLEENEFQIIKKNMIESTLPKIWIEKTIVQNRQDRLSGERAYGKCLWSPQRDKRGADIYKNMREVKRGDIVLHFINNQNFDSISIVKDGYIETTGTEGTDWEGPAYLITLENHTKLSPVIDRTLLLNDKYRSRLKEIANKTEVFYTSDLELRQGAYLTPCSLDLFQIINEVYLKLSKNILPFSDLIDISNVSTKLKAFEVDELLTSIKKTGYNLNELLVIRFVCSVISKPFVILTGLSGSGKTKLAQVFVKWICEHENQYKIIPVGADWTNREPLFGYPNSLEREKYILPDNGTLPLLLEARKEENQSKPYFLILDEMNLSHVERYFADFLSAMESGEAIPLHNGVGDWHGVPSSIKLPKNLFVIGTVNIDETTYMFSPKVLDRANVIEFRVTKEEMSKYLDSDTKLDLDSLTAGGASMGASFVTIANDKSLTSKNKNELNEELLKFFIELKKSGAEFGYRSASEMNRFAAVVNELEPTWAQWQIVDSAIMQKLLPKVHGSRKKLQPVLEKLAELCLNDPSVFTDYIKNGSDSIPSDKIKYPVSMEKIGRMYRALLENSFTSYAEA